MKLRDPIRTQTMVGELLEVLDSNDLPKLLRRPSESVVPKVIVRLVRMSRLVPDVLLDSRIAVRSLVFFGGYLAKKSHLDDNGL